MAKCPNCNAENEGEYCSQCGTFNAGSNEHVVYQSPEPIRRNWFGHHRLHYGCV